MVPDVRFGSKTDMCSARTYSALGQKRTHANAAKKIVIDHLVGGHEEAGRHRKTKCLRCLEVDSRLTEVFIAAR